MVEDGWKTIFFSGTSIFEGYDNFRKGNEATHYLDPETVSNQKLFVIVKSHIQQFFAIIWVHTTLFVQNRRIAWSAIEIGHRDTVASFHWETIF